MITIGLFLCSYRLLFLLLFIGWTMAFKAVSGVNKNVYSTYTSDQTSSEKVFAALEVTNRHFNHYKNRIVLKWQDIGPTEVLHILFYFCCNIAFINLPVKCSITCMTDREPSQGLRSSWSLLVGYERICGSVRESEWPGASEYQARQTFDGEGKGGNSREYLHPRASFAISLAFIPPCPLQGIDDMSSAFVMPEIAYNDPALNQNDSLQRNIIHGQQLINNIISFAFC